MSNSTEEAFDHAASVANGTYVDQGTNQKDPVNTPPAEGEPQVDYKTKFSASSAEALRLLEENKAKDAEIERLKRIAEGNQPPHTPTDEVLYPGFEGLTPEEQQNFMNYTKAVEERVRGSIYSDPAIAYAQQTFKDKAWNEAFEKVSAKFPKLKEAPQEFKTKFFQPNKDIPSNLEELMEGMAKIHLFDSEAARGAAEEAAKANRIDTERVNGGPKTAPTSRTMDEWEQMAINNPAEFALHAKEYNEDLASGKLKT